MWDRRRGEVWHAKYRVGASRQVQKRLGPAWTERGRPPAGYFIKRTADDWLRHTLDEARRGTLAGMVQTGATFADVGGALTTPKSGNVRSVPMTPRVAETLAQLGTAPLRDRRRRHRVRRRARSVRRRFAAAAPLPRRAAGRGCGRCAFTICATPSGRA
jgi:hypothetical protein